MKEVSSSTRPCAFGRLFLWFLLANVVCGVFVFRGGLWGDSILAPLDCLPAVCDKYKFMDPDTTGVPANHYIIDQATYDLPVQTSIYRSYRSGEIPWWDPYNWAGRPLLAEAHINGTEPIRVLSYLTLPFVTAYNWTRVLNYVFSGLSMLMLLRHWRMPGYACLLLALAYEFAGGFVLYFGHPWIQSAFNYYPLIWIAWDAWFHDRRWWSLPLATVGVAGVFNAGNLQSHAYLVMFSGAILLGYGGFSWPRWKNLLPLVAVSGVLGAALASPFLLNEVEMYRLSLRTGELHTAASPLGGLLSLSAVYPWAIGTFRTLDIGKIFHCSNMGFHLFIGSPAIVLALLGAWHRPADDRLGPVRRVAWILVAIYFLIICTPLEGMFYTRSAGLAVLGLIPLAALGLVFLMQTTLPLRRVGLATLALTLLLAIGTNVASLLIYPHYLARVRQMVFAQNEHTITGFGEARALREFQINNFANEVSFKNPGTVFATLGLLTLAGVCLAPTWRRRAGVPATLLVLNLVPQLLFSYQYIPVQPIALWQKLTADDTEQHRVAEVLRPGCERLMDTFSYGFDRLYPNSLSHLFAVRYIFGYSSLQPFSFSNLSIEELKALSPRAADYFYDNGAPGATVGELRKNPTAGLARFQWVGSVDRSITVAGESMNEVRLAIQPGAEAELVRSDTWYPGWSAWAGTTKLELQKVEPFFSKIKVPADASSVVYRYEPTYLRTGIKLAAVSFLVLIIASVLLRRRSATVAGA